jgi:hypothetical protein
LKRKVSNGTWTTHFLVLEVPLGGHNIGSDEKTIVVLKTFGRVGTGKVNHEDRLLELMKMAERLKAVLV